MKKFTLIELLVVVAIIGILASMLLPSLSRAREASRRAVCKSNHHQFYLSVQMYADDNNGRFVPNRANQPVQKIPAADKLLLDPYIPSWEVTDCPNFPLKDNTYGQGVTTNQQTGILLLGGLVNAANIGAMTDWDSPQHFSDDSDLVLLADYNEVPGGSWKTRFTHTRTGGFATNQPMQPADAGVQGTVITKLNGSTEWQPLGKMKSHAANPSHTGVQYWW